MGSDLHRRREAPRRRSSGGMPPVPRRDWVPPSRRRVRALRDRLRLVYGRPIAPPHRRPLEELDPHRPLPVDVRPQPRRRLPAPRRALPRLGRGARRAQRRGRGGDPARRDLQGEVGPHPGDAARAARPAVARPSRAHDGRGRPRRALRAARGGPQDRGLRAALRLRHARHPGRHARLARRHPARACSGRARRSRSSTTRCSTSPRAARSTSSTSTSCATAGAPATRSGRSAANAISGGCARGRRGGPVSEPVVTWYLELRDPSAIRPARGGRRSSASTRPTAA